MTKDTSYNKTCLNSNYKKMVLFTKIKILYSKKYLLPNAFSKQFLYQITIYLQQKYLFQEVSCHSILALQAWRQAAQATCNLHSMVASLQVHWTGLMQKSRRRLGRRTFSSLVQQQMKSLGCARKERMERYKVCNFFKFG